MVALRHSFLDDDRGQGLVEYAIVIALIAIVCVVSLAALASHTKSSLSNSASRLPG